jgi:hypothetical protein
MLLTMTIVCHNSNLDKPVYLLVTKVVQRQTRPSLLFFRRIKKRGERKREKMLMMMTLIRIQRKEKERKQKLVRTLICICMSYHLTGHANYHSATSHNA